MCDTEYCLASDAVWKVEIWIEEQNKRRKGGKKEGERKEERKRKNQSSKSGLYSTLISSL